VIRDLVAGNRAFVTMDDVLAAERSDPTGLVRMRSIKRPVTKYSEYPTFLRAIKNAVDDDRRPGPRLGLTTGRPGSTSLFWSTCFLSNGGSVGFRTD
jgi:hypothetical protein